MSLDKAIIFGKEKRKQYRGAKSIDPSCRNHGGCPWCEEGRMHKYRRDMIRMEEQENEFITGDDCDT